MNKEDLGKKFYKDGKIYEAIAYSDMPTIELKNVDNNDERISVVVGSDYSKQFQLIEDTSEEDKKIEKLNEHIFVDVHSMVLKINEIIDRLNKL